MRVVPKTAISGGRDAATGTVLLTDNPNAGAGANT